MMIVRFLLHESSELAGKNSLCGNPLMKNTVYQINDFEDWFEIGIFKNSIAEFLINRIANEKR